MNLAISLGLLAFAARARAIVDGAGRAARLIARVGMRREEGREEGREGEGLP